MKRVLTALLLIPTVLFLNFLAPSPVVWASLALVALLCLSELFEIAGKVRLQPFRIAGYGAGAVLIFGRGLPEVPFLVGLTAILLLLSLQGALPLSDTLGAVASTLFGLLYVCGPFVLAREIHGLSPHWLFFVLLMNWVGDSAAYYVGRRFGRHALAPQISPKKTWEGTIASTLVAMPVGAAYLLYFQPTELHAGLAVALALSVNVAAQLGDLAESALKRGADVKDSGHLLPGHGGMLDRVDGILFSLPVCYFFVSAIV